MAEGGAFFVAAAERAQAVSDAVAKETDDSDGGIAALLNTMDTKANEERIAAAAWATAAENLRVGIELRDSSAAAFSVMTTVTDEQT
jgi:hypothetical protein